MCPDSQLCKLANAKKHQDTHKHQVAVRFAKKRKSLKKGEDTVPHESFNFPGSEMHLDGSFDMNDGIWPCNEEDYGKCMSLIVRCDDDTPAMICSVDPTTFKITDDLAEKHISELILKLDEWTVNMSTYNFWPKGEEIAQTDGIFGIMLNEDEDELDEPDDCTSVFASHIQY